MRWRKWRRGAGRRRGRPVQVDGIHGGGFVTAPGCEDKCSDADVGEGSAPMGKCDSSALAGCECVYSEKYCSSECEPTTGEWLTQCEGGEEGTPLSEKTGTPKEVVLGSAYVLAIEKVHRNSE